MSDLALFAVASDGSTGQWDGLKTPVGISLRWWPTAGLSFPDQGYDVYRAVVPDARHFTLDDTTVAGIRGQSNYTYRTDVTLSQQTGFAIGGDQATGWRLLINPGDTLVLQFPNLAWSFSIPALPAGSQFSVLGFSNGQLRRTATVSAGTANLEWLTPGLDRIEFTGAGALPGFAYQLVNAAVSWTLLQHLCLPVAAPTYPCQPSVPSGSEEMMAISRVPPQVRPQWGARYHSGFQALLPYLQAFATRTALPTIPPATQPDAPATTLAPQDAVQTALLDPHLARVVGMAWDDPLNGHLDQGLYAYKVVGTWIGGTKTYPVTSPADLAALLPQGITFASAGAAPSVATGPLSVAITCPPGASIQVVFQNGVHDMALEAKLRLPLNWQALSGTSVLSRGSRPAGTSGVLSVGTTGMTMLQISGPADFSLSRIWLTNLDQRVGVVPGIRAAEPGPPVGPSWIQATLSQPAGAAGPMQASLDWEIHAAADGTYDQGASVFYQVGAQQLSSDPKIAAPSPPPFQQNFLLDEGSLIIVPTTVASQPSPRTLLLDRGFPATTLKEGWRAWWVRGVDLFGRVSVPTTPALALVADNAPPPPPVMLLGEYLQHDLPSSSAALIGYSPLAQNWSAQNPSLNAVSCVWAWTPELAALCPDVDAFKCYVRRPIPVSGAGVQDAVQSYDGISWGSSIAGLGPLPVSYLGNILSVSASASSSNDLFFIETDLSVNAPAQPFVLQWAGILVTTAGRCIVLNGAASTRGRTFLCRVSTAAGLPIPPAAVSTFTWYPAYACVVQDSGFGPMASAQRPTSQAQVSATAIRRSASRPVESDFARPALLMAVDATPPAPPNLAPIASGPYCAQLATRADWYGHSFFAGLSWVPDPNLVYVVYRALGDAIVKYDLAAHLGQGGAYLAHALPKDAWAAEIWNDPARNAQFDTDIQALDTALAAALTTGTAPREAAITAAYAALHADAQRVMAAQPYARSGFISLQGVPLTGAQLPFVDTLDGRSSAHWFYCVASRSASGMESAWSPPTPPICCPDVVPPRAPLMQSALADPAGNAVILHWLASPEPDLKCYRIFGSATAVLDVRDMNLKASVAPSSSSHAVVGLVSPSAVNGQPSWLSYSVPSPPGKWTFRMVAEDISGNVSAASSVVSARSLQPPPVPPVWRTGLRAAGPTGQMTIILTWTHPTDARLSCNLERQTPTGIGSGAWTSVTGWLPRGVYTFTDTSPAVQLALVYRITIRDRLGQTASSSPTLSVPTVP